MREIAIDSQEDFRKQVTDKEIARCLMAWLLTVGKDNAVISWHFIDALTDVMFDVIDVQKNERETYDVLDVLIRFNYVNWEIHNGGWCMTPIAKRVLEDKEVN